MEPAHNQVSEDAIFEYFGVSRDNQNPVEDEYMNLISLNDKYQEGGFLDEEMFYNQKDGSFFDPNGVYFDSDGYDDFGGYYDDDGNYVEGELYEEDEIVDHAKYVDDCSKAIKTIKEEEKAIEGRIMYLGRNATEEQVRKVLAASKVALKDGSAVQFLPCSFMPEIYKDAKLILKNKEAALNLLKLHQDNESFGLEIEVEFPELHIQLCFIASKADEGTAKKEEKKKSQQKAMLAAAKSEAVKKSEKLTEEEGLEFSKL